jgi:Cytochrome P460
MVLKIEGDTSMKRITFLPIAAAIVASLLALTPHASGHTDERTSPNYEIKVPVGYRDWKLVSVAHEAGNLNDIRAILGNDVAIKAFREEKLPFPDGTIIARLAWNYVPSEENNKVFGREQSFVAGPPTNVQFMVKDSKKYFATGGWGLAQFTNGKPINEAEPKSCFSCHEPAKAQDFVFTRYAP